MKIRASTIEKIDPDKILWHYTTPEVLWKMLAGEFYATHYRFMNDSAEIIYGIQEFKHSIDRGNGLDSFRTMVKYLQEIDFFLLCFSEFPDSLYHWRSYAPKGGFCIGFSHNEMCDIFNNIKYGKSGVFCNNSLDFSRIRRQCISAYHDAHSAQHRNPAADRGMSAVFPFIRCPNDCC